MENTTVSEVPTQRIITNTLPQKKNLKIILLIVLGLIVVAGAVYAGIQIGKRSQIKVWTEPPLTSESTLIPAETANWKTYTNEKYGYSIKYPQNWFIKDVTSLINAANVLDDQFLNDQANIDVNNFKVHITVNSTDFERSKSFLNFSDMGLQNEAEITTALVEGKEIVKAVVTFSQYDQKTSNYVEEGKSYKILIPLGGNTLSMSSKLDDRDLVDNVLSTFKFIPAQNDVTKDWQTYTLSKINLEIKLPPELSRLGNLKEEIIAGEKGTVFCASFPAKISLLVKNVYAGGMGCNVYTFGIGGTSFDFEAGRSSFFTDYQGFVIEDGKYLAKFVGGQKVEIRKDLVKEITNRYGVKILRVIGRKQSDPESPFPVPGTPGEGWVGAFVNIPGNVGYSGIVVQMKLEDDLNIDLFDQILSTFRFDN